MLPEFLEKVGAVGESFGKEGLDDALRAVVDYCERWLLLLERADAEYEYFTQEEA